MKRSLPFADHRSIGPPNRTTPRRNPAAPAAIFAAAWLLLVAVEQGRCDEPARSPNIVVILVDDLGYGDLSSFGATDLRTPAIDNLVAAGMRLDNFYANCPVCSPTRAALLTGRYPDLVGVPGVVRTYPHDNWGYLSPQAVLLPTVLAKAGYHTAIIGKWHLGLESPNRPCDRGFDLFHGFLGDMMDDYYKHRRHGINYMRKNYETIDPPGHATDLFSQWAFDYLRARAAAREPFFLYLAYNAPHTPIQPPADWVEKVVRRRPGIDPRRARLVALVEHMDHGIAQVLGVLGETGLADDTMIVFSSDNGGQLSIGANNGNLRGGKEDMYEGGLKVPTCAVWPGKIRPGTRSGEIAATMDLFPTLCEAAGARFDHAIDGRSILPTLLGKPQTLEPRDLFFTRREGNQRYAGKAVHAVRHGDWKLVYNSPFAPMELFNLKEDPKEQNNLYQQAHRERNELVGLLRAHIQRAGSVPWQKEGGGQ